MLSPASIACACSRSPSILIVMPVFACSSKSLSNGRGPIWLTSSSTRTVLRFALNSPLSICARRLDSANVRSIPA